MKVEKIVWASLMCSAITLTQADTSLSDLKLPSQKLALNAQSFSLARADIAVSKKITVINGKQFTFVKYAGKEGNTYSKVFNANNKEISPNEVPVAVRQIADEELLAVLSRAGRVKVNVNIALNIEPLTVREESQVGSTVEQEGLIIESTLNNKKVNPSVLEELSKKRGLQQYELNAASAKYAGKQVQEWLQRHDIKIDDSLKQAIVNGDDVLNVQLPAQQIVRLIESGDKAIAGIELYKEPKDTINAAMVDTSITSSALPYSSTRGDNIGIYMTESGCAQESRISNYDRLSGSETNHSRNVGAIIRAVSPDSFLYCRGGARLPRNNDLDGVGGNPDIYVVNRSNGFDGNDTYRTLDRSWDNFVYDHNVATFISAGNEGGSGNEMISPAKGHNIVSVGNYNDSTDTISSGSSFKDPQTKNDKPEISAPGTSITAGGFTMSGTSMSSPHAAAFAADMMSSSTYLKHRPYLVKAKIMAGATDVISGGYDKVGVGGIDFASAQWSGYASWHSGNNGSFPSFANSDGSPDQYIERNVYISSGYDDARVVLSWLNRGSYTYNHRNDAHPIGMDLDMRIYDPSGNFVGGSYSWDNNFETVNFTPTVSGYYKIKVNRYANRDTSSNLRMGIYVNYYN